MICFTAKLLGAQFHLFIRQSPRKLIPGVNSSCINHKYVQDTFSTMWSKSRILTGVGTCLGLGIGSIYFKTTTLHAESFKEVNEQLSSCPYLVWNFDWDSRAPRKKGKDGKEELDSSKYPKYSRTIWLINDVQHKRHEDDTKQEPTAIGLQQMKKLSEILKKITQTRKIKWETIYHSTILRSRAQAAIVKRALNDDVKLTVMNALVEGVPVEAIPQVSDIPCVLPEVIFQDRPRVESVFATIFHRADAKQKADSHELVFAHPNVIRYFICRVLQMPPEAFSRFHLFHASITRIKISGSGSVVVEVLGDAGYLPRDLLTSGELKGAPAILVDPDIRPNEEVVEKIQRIMRAVEESKKN